MRNFNLIIVFLILCLGTASYSFDVGFKAPAVSSTAKVISPELGALVFDTTTGIFWGNSTTPAAPIWLPLSPVSQNFASGYFANGYEWEIATGTGAFTNFTNVSAASFVTTNQSFTNVTEPAGHGFGITLYPNATTSVFRITFKANGCAFGGVLPSGAPVGMRLYDSANNIEVDEMYFVSTDEILLTGLYKPGTTLPVTLLVQGALPSGLGPLDCEAGGYAMSPSAFWNVQSIK